MKLTKISGVVFDTRRLGAKNADDARDLMEYAHEKGIEVFDISPHFMEGACERVFLQAREELSFEPQISYKFGRVPNASDTAESFSREFYDALGRFRVSAFDMYTVYDINSFETWSDYKNDGEVYETAVELKNRGLIKRLAVVCTLGGDELKEVLSDIPDIDCVFMPVSPLELKARSGAMELCRAHGIEVFALTPLLGGVFRRFPRLLSPIVTPGLSDEQAALRLLNRAGLGLMCAFTKKSEIDMLEAALSDDAPEVKINGDFGSYETFCTACGLCRMCPIKSHVTTLMAAYNAYVASGDPGDMVKHARRAFGEDEYLYNTRKCIGCRLCERICPQGIHISERIEHLRNEAHKT